MNHIPWLTLLIVIPAGAAILLQLVPRRYTAAVKGLTILATLAGAVIVTLLLIWMPGNKASGGPLPLHFQETHAWLPAINASYHLGIDGISAWLLALNAGVFLLGALAISRKATDRLRFYCTLVLLTQAATTGVLLSIDLLLFYMFWEGMLVPLYILLSNWGGEKRGPATIKFIVYTVAGSLLMLVAIIYLYIQSPSGSFDLESILAQPISSGSAFVIPIIHVSTFTPKELGVSSRGAGVLRGHREQARRVWIHPLRADDLPRGDGEIPVCAGGVRRAQHHLRRADGALRT
jgi:NADH-quinone oxidoreductase subunit M